jgi:hypothetical protein
VKHFLHRQTPIRHEGLKGAKEKLMGLGIRWEIKTPEMGIGKREIRLCRKPAFAVP